MKTGTIVKQETRVVYSANGRPYTMIVTVRRGCSDDPEKELENFLRTCGQIAEKVERRLAKQEAEKRKGVIP